MYIRRVISVAGAALSIGVCVFITWISRDVDNTTIVFNLVFLALMLLMLAAAYIVGLRRLIQVEQALSQGTEAIRRAAVAGEAVPSGGSADLFHNEFLDDCYRQHRRMMRQNPDGSCDIQDFISEDAIETYVHRGVLESIPDILTSLGILGTFVGLVMGLREFDPSGYEQMAGSITPLINGIKVAFITSIYGIALSLSFSFNLRSEFSNLSSVMDEFLDTYYLHVHPSFEVHSLSLLLKQKKDQEDLVHDLTGIFVEQMGKSFEQAITPAFAQMADGFQSVTNAFLQSQEEILTNVCEHVTQQMRTELLSDFSQITKTVDELGKNQARYTEFMDRTMLQIQQSFASLQDSITETQQYLSDSLHNLNDASEDAFRINQEQKATYQDYIRFMYQSIENFSQIWEHNSQELKHYSDEIVKMGPVQSATEIKNQLAKLSEQLEEISSRQQETELATNEDSQEEMQELLQKMLKKLDEMNKLINTPRFFRGRKRK